MLKVGIVGPESTGKSELSKRLAEHFQCPWIPEYAREYLEQLDRPYEFDDLELIARKTYDLIESCDKSGKYCFVDTELLVMKIWSEFKYKNCAPFILEQLDKQGIDCYLLCYPDIPWEYDSLRENPENRLELFEIYREGLIALQKPFAIISSNYENRLRMSIAFLDELALNPGK